MAQKRPVVAIDGPVGAGKSSVSKAVAAKLSYGFVDSGAMYRCIALQSLDSNVDPSDVPALKALAEGVKIRFEMTPEGVNKVFLGDREVTKEIREEKVSNR